MTEAISQRSAARAGWREVFLTAVPPQPVEDDAGLREVFDAVAAAVAEQRLEVLQEKVYAPAAQMDRVRAARRAAYEAGGADPDVPATLIDGRPCVGGLLAGVQVIGAALEGDDLRCRTLAHEGRPAGRLLRTRHDERLYLAGVSGLGSDGGDSVTAQAERMFRRARDLLRAAGFSPLEIVRTWIYLARLLDWYGEFNQVRNRLYREFGLLADGDASRLPASTGIQGRRVPGEECFMDVLAIRDEGGRPAGVAPMSNTRQNEAYEYGSSFCRGMAVRGDGPLTMYISGTASISCGGQTVYHQDHQGQVVETLLDVDALLGTEGARLKDVCQATVYCKGEEDYRVFQRIRRFIDREEVPFLCVYADVCRDELLFEVDAIAMRD